MNEEFVRRKIGEEAGIGDLASDLFVDGKLDIQDLHYWRKHPNLHGAFYDLYREKNGLDEMFNGSKLRLRDDDLIKLEQRITNKELPHTTGFFFGSSSDDDESVAHDLEFIKNARKHIANGDFVYYDSSW